MVPRHRSLASKGPENGKTDPSLNPAAAGVFNPRPRAVKGGFSEGGIADLRLGLWGFLKDSVMFCFAICFTATCMPVTSFLRVESSGGWSLLCKSGGEVLLLALGPGVSRGL